MVKAHLAAGREFRDLAVEIGLAVVTVEVSEDNAPGLTIGAYERVLADAALVVARSDENANGDLVVTVQLEQEFTKPIHLLALVGALVATQPLPTPIGGSNVAD